MPNLASNKKLPLPNTSTTTELDILKSILDIVAKMQTQSNNSNFSSATKPEPHQTDVKSPSHTLLRESLISDMS